MYDESRPQVFRRQPRIFIDPKHQSALHPGKQYANFFSQLPEYPTSGRTCQKYAASTWTASQLVFTKDMSFPSASLPHDLHSERGYAFTKVRMTRVFGLLTARLIFRNSGNVLRWSATSSEMSSVALLMKSVSWSFWRWAETNGRWSWQRERCVILGFSHFFPDRVFSTCQTLSGNTSCSPAFLVFPAVMRPLDIAL